MSESNPGSFDPAEAGKELANPNETTDNEDNETAMSQNQRPTSDSSNDTMTAAKPAEAINGFGGLYPRFTGQTMATVLSLRNGDVSAYRVDVSTLDCWCPNGDECPDNEYNQNGAGVEGYMGANVCDHIACAIHAAPKKPDLGIKTIDGMIDMLGETKNAAENAHNTAKVLERAQSNHAAVNSSQVQQSTPEENESNAGGNGSSAEEAAERLQEAYDNATNGMATEAYNGLVWVNKTPDAPEWTFDAFLRDADHVQYAPDDDSPGSYWKNYVEPENVESYISEVLE